MPHCVKSTCRLFADDCLLYRSIATTDDIDIIQQDLYCLEQWANKWLMKFNTMKCVALTVTNKTHPIYSEYSLYNQKLELVSEAKYLGLTLDTNLNFNRHIDIICKKANSTLGFIRKNTYYCQRYVKADAYNTYVRPILDYAAFVWPPHTIRNINILESVQRQAAHYVMSDYNRYSSVSNMISALGWKSLKQHRNIQTLCVFYKILNGLVDVVPLDCLTPSYPATRGHQKKFCQI